MKSIKMPFGLNKGNNSLIHISHAKIGKKCECVCPNHECGANLIAVKGNIRQHHFRHEAGYECDKGLESSIHLGAKKIISEKKILMLPEYICSVRERDRSGKEYVEQKIIIRGKEFIKFDTVQEEKCIYEMKADLIAIKNDREIIIEIFYSHKVDEEKIYKIKNNNISAIEIDLSNVKPEDVKDLDSFWLCINDAKNIKWLHNARDVEERKKLTDKIQSMINAQEEKIRKQQQAEKDKLQTAIKNLQDYINNIKDSKDYGEEHLAWKYAKQRLHLSWQELPSILNMDVPGGDWIFGCDHRVWQSAFYSYMSSRKIGGKFCVKMISEWLIKKGCKVSPYIKIITIYNKNHPSIVPDNLKSNTWNVLKSYFFQLHDLGVLKYVNNDYNQPGNVWFEIKSKELKQ